jgi:uncharacterized protein DUF4864
MENSMAKPATTRFGLSVLVPIAFLASPAFAQQAAEPSPVEWQAVIAGQILAFRTHDAPGALSFAAAAFHQAYPDPNDFFIAIVSSGYSPIMESSRQQFGPYKLVAPDQVLQDVKLTGNDQSIYEAIYMLAKEKDGWRVNGVRLVKTSAVGV